MDVAETFLKYLREGKTSEAIKVAGDSIKERTEKLFTESREELLKSYGFVVAEKKKMKEGDMEGDPDNDDDDDTSDGGDNDDDSEDNASDDDNDKKIVKTKENPTQNID